MRLRGTHSETSSQAGPAPQPYPATSGDDCQTSPVVSGRLQDFADQPLACMRRLQRQCGDLAVLREADQQLVFAFGPQWNKRILADSDTFHSRFFAVRGSRRSSQRRVTSGLLSMNGPTHRSHRRMVMGPFQKRALEGYRPYIAQLAKNMLDGWQVGEIRDVNADMTRFMLQLTSAILFGFDLPDLTVELGEKIDRWTTLNHETGMGAFVSDPVYLERYDRLLDLAEDLEQSVSRLIEHRRRSADPGHDVLSLLLRAHDEAGQLGDEELVGHVTLLFGAAHLTTAHSFSWTLFLLAQHPGVMQQVVTALNGASEVPASSGAGVLERVLKESMRILPASAYSQRICAADVQLGPLQLPAGTPVIFSQFMTHHDERLYPHPQRFDPDRWLDFSPTAYEYLPFGAGPRMCIGGPLALMILQTVLPMIWERFQLESVAGTEVSGNVVSTMLGPTAPLTMRLLDPTQAAQSQPVTGNIHELVQLSRADQLPGTSLPRAA